MKRRAAWGVMHGFCAVRVLGTGRWAWGVGHGALGMGHGALGMGHWALGIGHWALGIERWACRAYCVPWHHAQARRGATPARRPSDEIARGSCASATGAQIVAPTRTLCLALTPTPAPAPAAASGPALSKSLSLRLTLASYHRECFKCAACTKPLFVGFTIGEDGGTYCRQYQRE